MASEYRKSFGRSRSASPQRSVSSEERRSDVTAHGSSGAGRSVLAAGLDPHRNRNSVDHHSKAPVKPRPPKSDSQLQASSPNRHGPPANEDRQAPCWGAGPRSKEGASPLLMAQQVLRSGCWSPRPFRRHPVAMETEYRRSYQGQTLPPGPRLRKHLEHQLPIFHMHTSKSVMQHDDPTHQREATPPSHSRHRKLTEYEANFLSPVNKMVKEGAPSNHASQAAALRRQASWYRRRAWGTHFSREHLNQLLSEHNRLWEPADSTQGATSPRSASERRGSPRVEALDLDSSSSLSGAASSGPAHRVAEHHHATDEEEGRLPTPKMKMQRTHHDVTTPATGGAILVGRPPGKEGCTSTQVSARALQGCGDSVSVATPKEAWPDNPSPLQNSKPIRPRLSLAPQHRLRGRLRHAEFQHNGELGLRFRGRSGSSSHQEDALSAMSCRSAASRSAASAILEHAQRRREDFWGKI
uniref:nuclear protein MDM1 isoform X2 n=1 Tax=Doryrhamphus excisus TaxID=161450 RepID=UPI0025AE37E2|nr:nuclear protein MDM1 isoform X2 [Doryrhamphus excisus]